MMVHVAIDGSVFKLKLEKLKLDGPGEDGAFTCELESDGNAASVVRGTARLLEAGVLSLLIDGRSYRCLLEPATASAEPAVYVEGERYEYRIEDPRSLKARRGRAGSDAGPRALKAPMPGRVVRVMVEAGAKVEANQPILVIEAMKMQNELKSPKAGTVAEIRVVAGDTVNAGQVLATVR